MSSTARPVLIAVALVLTLPSCERSASPDVGPTNGAAVPDRAVRCRDDAAKIIRLRIAGDEKAAERVAGTTSEAWRVAEALLPQTKRAAREAGPEAATTQAFTWAGELCGLY